MLLGSCQNKNSIGRWFLQRFQKGVESRLGEHVHLVDNENLVFSLLGLKANLLNQRADIFDAVVGSRIQLDDVERCIFVKGIAGWAVIAGFVVGRQILTV